MTDEQLDLRLATDEEALAVAPYLGARAALLYALVRADMIRPPRTPAEEELWDRLREFYPGRPVRVER